MYDEILQAMATNPTFLHTVYVWKKKSMEKKKEKGDDDNREGDDKMQEGYGDDDNREGDDGDKTQEEYDAVIGKKGTSAADAIVDVPMEEGYAVEKKSSPTSVFSDTEYNSENEIGILHSVGAHTVDDMENIESGPTSANEVASFEDFLNDLDGDSMVSTLNSAEPYVEPNSSMLDFSDVSGDENEPTTPNVQGRSEDEDERSIKTNLSTSSTQTTHERKKAIKKKEPTVAFTRNHDGGAFFQLTNRDPNHLIADEHNFHVSSVTTVPPCILEEEADQQEEWRRLQEQFEFLIGEEFRRDIPEPPDLSRLTISSYIRKCLSKLPTISIKLITEKMANWGHHAKKKEDVVVKKTKTPSDSIKMIITAKELNDKILNDPHKPTLFFPEEPMVQLRSYRLPCFKTDGKWVILRDPNLPKPGDANRAYALQYDTSMFQHAIARFEAMSDKTAHLAVAWAMIPQAMNLTTLIPDAFRGEENAYSNSKKYDHKYFTILIPPRMMSIKTAKNAFHTKTSFDPVVFPPDEDHRMNLNILTIGIRESLYIYSAMDGDVNLQFSKPIDEEFTKNSTVIRNSIRIQALRRYTKGLVCNIAPSSKEIEGRLDGHPNNIIADISNANGSILTKVALYYGNRKIHVIYLDWYQTTNFAENIILKTIQYLVPQLFLQNLLLSKAEIVFRNFPSLKSIFIDKKTIPTELQVLLLKYFEFQPIHATDNLFWVATNLSTIDNRRDITYPKRKDEFQENTKNILHSGYRVDQPSYQFGLSSKDSLDTYFIRMRLKDPKNLHAFLVEYEGAMK
jgi:hypothetical protein